MVRLYCTAAAMNKSVLVFLTLVSVSVAATYSPDDALKSLFLAFSAFCPIPRIANWDCYFCSRFSASAGALNVTATVSSNSNIFGYVGYVGTTAVVALRGTQIYSIQNWISDINTVYTPYSIPSSFGTGAVHKGFYDAWLSIKPQIQLEIGKLLALTTITQVNFTGHSLGAALCAWAAFELGPSLGKPFSMYNFGQPRLGNPAFAQYWHAQIPQGFRVVTYGDVVPQLPPQFFGAFAHSPTEVWYYRNNTYRVCNPNNGEDPNCSNSLYTFQYNVPDHLTYLGEDALDGGCV